MRGGSDLLICRATIRGRTGLDVLIVNGRIREIAERIRSSATTLDAQGGALIPGLADHHVHLFALAAEADTIRLTGPLSSEAFRDLLSARASACKSSTGLRVVGWVETAERDLDRTALDALSPPGVLVRVQDRTGAGWVLNSLALEHALAGAPPPPCMELDASGWPTGRIWRGDAWLRGRFGQTPPDLAPIGRRLASYGVTSITDASATTDERQAGLLAQAVRDEAIPQRLRLMSAGPLAGPADGCVEVGEVKFLLDDADLPDLDQTAERVRLARRAGRGVAFHCVTAGELAFSMAALEASDGARSGDRIEHGGVILPEVRAQLAKLDLTVVTQPHFIAERGDRYLRTVESEDLDSLYPCATLLQAGVQVAGGTDAPYGGADPWAAMRAAVSRTTSSGALLGPAERISPTGALSLFLGRADQPARPRRVELGAAADLCLLKAPLANALARLSSAEVAATVIAGRVTYLA